MEDELIRENEKLIYSVIKDLHIYWKTQDDYQDYVDAGFDGLLKGIRTFDESKGVAKSTYLYKCIKFELCKMITFKNRKKNTMEMVSLNTSVNDLEETELIDLIPSTDDPIENVVEHNSRNDKLIEIINTLPIREDRYVIKFCFGLDGYPELNCNQIAKRWGVSHQAIDVRKKRALSMLYKKLKNEDML